MTLPKTFNLGRPPIHDWDSLFDGEIHTLVRGEDFTCKNASFRTLVHRSARDRGLKARVVFDRKDDTLCLILAYRPEGTR